MLLDDPLVLTGDLGPHLGNARSKRLLLTTYYLLLTTHYLLLTYLLTSSRQRKVEAICPHCRSRQNPRHESVWHGSRPCGRRRPLSDAARKYDRCHPMAAKGCHCWQGCCRRRWLVLMIEHYARVVPTSLDPSARRHDGARGRPYRTGSRAPELSCLARCGPFNSAAAPVTVTVTV